MIWHRPGAIGDVLMTLFLIEPFRKKNPDVEIWYRTHPSTSRHLEELMLQAGVDRVISSEEPAPEHDVQYNLVGYPIHEGHPAVPMKGRLLDYFGKELGLENGYRSATLSVPRPPPPMLPGLTGHSEGFVTLQVKAGWSIYKEWPLERWVEVVRYVQERGFAVVQIGGPDDPKVPGAIHTALGQPLSFSLACIAHAHFHLGIDSWSNHASHILWQGKGTTPAVIVWGSTSSHSLGYQNNLNVEASGVACRPCYKENPWISKVPGGPCANPPNQTYENPQHACMQEVSVQDVQLAFQKLLWEWERENT